MTHLTMVRLADGLQHHFRPAGTCNGRPIYRDAQARDLAIYWDGRRGWVFHDLTGAALAGPDEGADLPPEGLWTGSGAPQRIRYRLTRGG